MTPDAPALCWRGVLPGFDRGGLWREYLGKEQELGWGGAAVGVAHGVGSVDASGGSIWVMGKTSGVWAGIVRGTRSGWLSGGGLDRGGA